MPAVNWNSFESLPGSQQSNFEMLCRSLIKRHYGRFADFAARAMQPGVEFHLKVHTSCVLGKPGDWFGWQCRWYGLSSGVSLGPARRKKIEEALVTTARVLPGLTDWVLWTRHPLTAGDQTWFVGLNTKMRLHQWTAADAEDLLSGDAEILRGTYFGELVLVQNNLAELHKASVARIAGRWMPDVHTAVDAERHLRRMLGEADSWGRLPEVGNKLKIAAKALTGDDLKFPTPLERWRPEFTKLADDLSKTLSDCHALLGRGDYDSLRQQLTARPSRPSEQIRSLPRRLRAARSNASLNTTNALADIVLAEELLGKIDEYIGQKVVGVLAGAGAGKTQLAAQLTANTKHKSCGILLHGKDLHAGQGIDSLARRVVIQGVPVPSMESLVAAVDAAGERGHYRLPIVIDGLNEAEDPREWKDILAVLDTILARYPYVLLVCTVRHLSLNRPMRTWRTATTDSDEPSFADEALPANILRLEIPDFGVDTYSAIRRYFTYYKINPVDADLPFDLLAHPLTLRLFCEATNKTRAKVVGVEAMPGSLTGLLECHLDEAARRIADLAPLRRRYCQQDVRIALDKFGMSLWNERLRSIDLKIFQEIIGETGVLWNESLVRALEQDSVLMRDAGEPPQGSRVAGLYDALSGHLIAKSLLSKLGRSGLESWLKDVTTQKALFGDYLEQHSLSTDIFQALIGLVPRQLNGQQLWSMLSEPFQLVALQKSADLEGKYLDGDTVARLAALPTVADGNDWNLFDRLRITRGSVSHPLNADFLNRILQPMTMADRDVRWTEWVRRMKDRVAGDLEQMERRWRSTSDRRASDRLRATWVMWLLTSTVRTLRDQATRALYWFGRSDPAALFEMTLASLAINDPYVPERMLATAYGTAMALHAAPEQDSFRKTTLPGFALELYKLMFSETAIYSTTHALKRDFARHIIEIATLHAPRLLRAGQRKRITPPFVDGGIRDWPAAEADAESDSHFGGALHMDFANYTLGRLVPNRGNYDYKTKDYRDVVASILWRMSQLGYSQAVFFEIDRRLSSSEGIHSRSARSEGRTDRYGKKYSWIAFYELYGYRYDRGLLRSKYSDSDERPTDVDIDPSFPDQPLQIRVVQDDWLGSRNQALEDWIARGHRPDIRPHLLVKDLKGVSGTWVLLDGFVAQVDEKAKRAIFGYARGLLIPKKTIALVKAGLENDRVGGHSLPEPPQDHYIFAGEVPWCDTFARNGFVDLEIHTGDRVKTVRRKETEFYRGVRKLTDSEAGELLLLLKDVARDLNSDDAVESFLKKEGVEVRVITKSEKVTERKVKNVRVMVPVRESCWESYHSGVNPQQNSTIPAREIAELYGLSIQLPGWNLCDSAGKTASVTVETGSLWTTGEKMCYLRKDLLDDFLQKKRLELVWVFWGEREIRLDQQEVNSKNVDFKHWNRNFQHVLQYVNGSVVSGRAFEYYD